MNGLFSGITTFPLHEENLQPIQREEKKNFPAARE
jgi:hypothetical protein